MFIQQLDSAYWLFKDQFIKALLQSYKVVAIIISILQMETERYTVVEQCAHGHTVGGGGRTVTEAA